MERVVCCVCNVDLSDRDDLENKMCYSCIVGDPMELDNHGINIERMHHENKRDRSCRI